jgi:deoxycytidine triphosphate deaminase
MEYQGIVITGTSGSGKSTVANLLCEKLPCQIVKAVTTRNRRSDDLPDSYEYITNEEYLALKNELIISAEYRDCFYGIKKEALNSVICQHKLPILILAPGSNIKEDFRFMSFFIDALDKQLDERLTTRNKTKENSTEINNQRVKDRELSRQFSYIIQNSDLNKTVEVIKSLWENRNSGGLLPKQIIRLMIECGMLLDKVEDLKNIQGASYDLTLGDEYYSRGRICTLTAKNPFIRIDPYDYAIVTSAENANLPRDVAAKFGLTVGLFCQGVVLSNGPQVDPGFNGKLFCLLFNTSNSPVVLKRREHHATIEFNKLLEPAPPYSGKYQGKDEIIYYLPSNTLKGAINELKEELESVKSESRKVNANALGIISVFLAILGVLLTLR